MLIHDVRLNNMKFQQQRPTLAISSLCISLLGPILTVLWVLFMMYISSLSSPERHQFGWVANVFRNVAIISLLLSPVLGMLLGVSALRRTKRLTGGMKGRSLARAGITISVLTFGFLVWMVPVRGRARCTSQTNACAGGNVRQLDSAKEQWAMATNTTNGPVDVEGILSYIKGGMPVCPAKGRYTLGNLGELPHCSIHGTITNRYCPKWWE